VPLRRFEERTGLPLTAIEARLSVAEQRGLIERDAFTLRASPVGLRFLNDLQELFLPTPVAMSMHGPGASTPQDRT
jgi:hypothetical protein